MFLRDDGCPPGRLRRGLGEDWGGGGALNGHLLWRLTLCLMETYVGRVRQGLTSQEVYCHLFLHQLFGLT